jgi:hypothetical protein
VNLLLLKEVATICLGCKTIFGVVEMKLLSERFPAMGILAIVSPLDGGQIALDLVIPPIGVMPLNWKPTVGWLGRLIATLGVVTVLRLAVLPI